MKKKLTTLLFGLLLAVGWTSSVFAQEATFTASEASEWTYDWVDAQGVTHYGADPTVKVTDAWQMYYLLRHVYMDKRFPGPFQSAYTKDGVRERDVYYGGIEGGWNIPGNTLGTPASTTITHTKETTGSVTAADGTSTSTGYQYMPVYGWYFESAQTNQMIYTKSQLDGMENGDQITSLTFYPRDAIYFYNGSITFSVANTTATSLSGSLSVSTTNVATVSTYTVSADGKWTITFDSPFTYTGNSLLIQAKTTAGDYGSSRTYFYGQDQSNNQSYNSYSRTTYSFLPKATFGYKRVLSATETVNGMYAQAIGDIIVTGSNAMIYSVTVKSGNTTLISWDFANDGTAATGNTEYWPLGFHLNSWSNWTQSGSPVAIGFASSGDVPITLDGWLFTGYNSVTVTISARAANGNSTSLIVNGDEKTFTDNTLQDYVWTINKKQFVAPMEYQADQYKPNKEGYTALVVKLKDTLSIEPDNPFYSQESFFETPQQIHDYLEANVVSIQLLTDGLRIGEGEGKGTVFNASDEYNRFFFLSKGQARQKADIVKEMQIFNQHALGEQVPFRQMFEQFSPTGGHSGDDITDFYSQMIKGKVYRVIHDCLSVIQNQHEFSMSGHTGTTAYAMTGLNFFIPDYRLKYWELQDTLKRNGHQIGIYTVDGRTMNPVLRVSPNGDPTYDRQYAIGNTRGSASDLNVWYAQYDTANHPPLVGIYLIDMNAVANPCPGYNEDNRYYQSTLDWTSSLNEMSGNGVKQTYIIYQVVTDSVTGNKVNVPIDTLEDCTDFHPQLTLDTLYEQHAHSYTITYVIQGSPSDSEHPGFIAWSDPKTVIIPGYDDFMVLNLHHYEADFDVNYTLERGKNYYRNYMQPENDFGNGITAESIRGGYDSFILYRTSEQDGKVPVAKLKFAVNNDGQVLYRISYYEENQDTEGPNDIDIDAIIQTLINTNN